MPVMDGVKGTLTVAARPSTDRTQTDARAHTDTVLRSTGLAGWRSRSAIGLLSLAGLTGLTGCGPSPEEAASNAYLATVNGLNIDTLVSRNLEPENADNRLTISTQVQTILEAWRKDSDTARALAALEATVAETSRDASAHYYIGKLQMRSGQAAPAIEAFRRTLELRTDLPEIWLDLATALAADNKPGEAYHAAHTAIAADPASSETLRRAARIFYQVQQFTAAEIAYTSLTQMEPDDPAVWHDRARNLAMDKRFALATTCFDKAVALYAQLEKPTAAQQRLRAEMLTDYGIMAQWENADEKAKILFENATAIDKTYAMAWFKLSQQQSNLRLKPLYDIDAAVLNANTAVSLSNGQNAEFLHQLARVYAITGNLDRAVIAEQEACKLVKDKYDQKLALLKRLQADRSKAFDPDNF